MRVAVVGASGKTGINVVRAALDRGYEVVGVCRESSVGRLDEFGGHSGLTIAPAAVVSDEAVLTRALEGCDAAVAVLISVRRLRATDLVTSLARAGNATGVKRFVFTAGEVTAVREPGERFTARQWALRGLGPLISAVTPYSMTDMIRASELVRVQGGWEWTIVRAPTLRDTPATEYRLSSLDDITAVDALSREDYAQALLDSIGEPGHWRRTLTVRPAGRA
jgi:putative NADH-flavin reductase